MNSIKNPIITALLIAFSMLLVHTIHVEGRVPVENKNLNVFIRNTPIWKVLIPDDKPTTQPTPPADHVIPADPNVQLLPGIGEIPESVSVEDGGDDDNTSAVDYGPPATDPVIPELPFQDDGANPALLGYMVDTVPVVATKPKTIVKPKPKTTVAKSKPKAKSVARKPSTKALVAKKSTPGKKKLVAAK